MAVKIYHGDILFTPSADRLEIHENSYIIVEDGVVSQICEKIPEQYQGAEVVDYGDKLIIPAFSDLHVHGAQYVQRGIGMDCLLSDWLNHYTFPQESRFQNMEYAKNCYDAFVDDMLRHGTFHANVFATIHREATNYLFDKMEEKGMYGYVGKVNMDCNSPEFLTETTEDSLKENHSGSPFCPDLQQAADRWSWQAGSKISLWCAHSSGRVSVGGTGSSESVSGL